MIDRDCLLILLGMLVIVLMTGLVALCSTGVLTAPNDPPEPDVEELMGSCESR